MKFKSLKKILSIHFLRYSLIPIFVVEVTLLILYFSINYYISNENTELLLKEAKTHTKQILNNEAKFISDELNEISNLAKILQKEHETIFQKPNSFGLVNGKPDFAEAKNGVFYKTNKIGASLYYSSKTKIGEKEKEKAIFTEAMDLSFKNIVDTNKNVVAAYFNSWDNMNRLYPFIDKVYEQYGKHINLEDYNFYYLADKKHNPKKEPVWTSAYLDPAGNGWMLSCIVPIYKGGFLEGVSGIDITIDSFVKNILNRKLSYDADLFLVDNKGMIIAMNEKIENILGLKELKEHLYTNTILKTIEKPEEFNILTNKSPFSKKFKDILSNNKEYTSIKVLDKKYLALKETVGETNWNLMILIDEEKIFASVKYLKELSDKIGYYAIAFLLLFYIIFFYILLRRIKLFSSEITKPIEHLSILTSKIKDVNAEVEIFDTQVKEVNQLNINFSKMMRELSLKNDQLEDNIKTVKRLSKAKDDFLANMSHELKTPLNSINVISSVMIKNKKGNLDEKDIENLKVLNSSGNDLLYLINDVLDISKLEARELKVKLEDILLSDFIKEIYDSFRLQFKEKNIDFSYVCNITHDFIHSDKTRLKQILKNIICNALKFTNEGYVKLEVKEESDYIEFIINDSGLGISPEKLEKIFDRFKQVDNSTTRQYGGTGLGLSIAKQLSKLLGGDIDVKSEIGLGSSFKVFVKSNIEKVSSSIQIEKNTFYEKEKVLIFNHDPINFINLVVNLKNDFEVDNISNKEEFFQKIKINKYKFLILDIDDYKNLGDLELKNKQEKLVLVYNKDSDINEKIKEIFNFSIKKPFDIEDIRNLLKL